MDLSFLLLFSIIHFFSRAHEYVSHNVGSFRALERSLFGAQPSKFEELIVIESHYCRVSACLRKAALEDFLREYRAPYLFAAEFCNALNDNLSLLMYWRAKNTTRLMTLFHEPFSNISN